MHDTALKIGEMFLAQYWRETYSVVVELGSYDVNGSLRKFQPSGSHWIGLDIECGPSVDVCIKPGAPLPLKSESVDVVLASSVFEHDEAFWQTFEELCRITRTGGVIYINAPSNGGYHRYPQDCWRFYPDASRALEKWVRSKGTEITLIESFVADREGDMWNDFVAVFGKGNVGPFAAPDYIHSHVSCRNVLRLGDPSVLHHRPATQDMDLLHAQVSAVAGLREAERLDLAEKGLLERDYRRIRMASGGAPGSLRPRVFTAHGTVLYVDPASRELRHGAIEQSPENAFFVAGGANGRIVHETGNDLQQTICLPHRSHAMDGPAVGDGPEEPTFFEATRIRRNWFALRAAGRFLCAELDGRVTLSRELCRAWESFLISDAIFRPDAKAGQSGAGRPPALGEDAGEMPEARGPRQYWGAESTAPGARQGRFARRRVIVVRHRGNLANKMIQYMGALTLASRIKGCEIVNVSIPEWGIELPDDTHNELFFDNIDLWTWDPFRPHVEDLSAIANRSESIRIMMGDHLLRMEFLRRPQHYNAIFPEGSSSSSNVLTEDDILINIRAAELLDGVPHYPLLPVSFYEDVVARTGKNPVFMGQLTPSRYVQHLRERFSGARFIESLGARADFDLIRSAKNIVISVSTFSWLAAWLSEAETIIIPLAGFYNPAHHREVDLLPVDDIRYRYFLFPLSYGLPEEQSLEYHRRIAGRWKEISRNQVALLKSASPFLRVPRENYDGGLPSRLARAPAITFDPVWYAHHYVDAAMEISEGWFEDPLHHYLEVGRLRGYLPVRPVRAWSPLDLSLPNLALGKLATQSSVSEWSRGATPEKDAGNAVNGQPSQDYGCHTDNDPNPWWMVDLASTARVSFIRIFNRDFIPDWMQRRASPLLVEASVDGKVWTLLLRTEQGHLFGGYSGGAPLVWSSSEPVEARFVRISILRKEYLHLAEVEIYGTALQHPQSPPLA